MEPLKLTRVGAVLEKVDAPDLVKREVARQPRPYEVNIEHVENRLGAIQAELRQIQQADQARFARWFARLRSPTRAAAGAIFWQGRMTATVKTLCASPAIASWRR